MSFKMNANRTTDGAIPETLLQGIAMDVSILDSLLRRHRCSHGRTIYFRRIKMVLNRLLRQGNYEGRRQREMLVVADAVCRLNYLQADINKFHQDQNREGASRKRRHNQEEERWDLQSLHGKGASDTPSSRYQLILKEFQGMIQDWTEKMPETLSRIEHASKALFIEVGRGFFLPFCTVALGALARIRSLLMEIGHHALANLRELSHELSQIPPKCGDGNLRFKYPTLSDSSYKKCMNLFLESNDNNDRKKAFISQSLSSTQNTIFNRNDILLSLGLVASTEILKRGDCNVPTINKNGVKERENDDVTTEPLCDDHYTLFIALPSEKALSEGEVDNKGNCARMDEDIIHIHDTRLVHSSRDSLDQNMLLVNRFQKINSKKQRPHVRDTNNNNSLQDSGKEDLLVGPERKKKKRRSKSKDSKKTKKKSTKSKTDFFDQLFD